jgi:hypothetical protein
LALALSLLTGQALHAETKTITAEANYIMGDGETPSFAEAMVLQKAKQTALEQAGTYVESYSKVRNLDLTVDEIQTLAGGVLSTEVLEKRRALVDDGLRFYVKINAIVVTDQMEELARRIKGKNLAEEYARLQASYGHLIKEIETLKARQLRSTLGRERDAALDQLRGYEQALATVKRMKGRSCSGWSMGKLCLIQPWTPRH